MSAARLISDLRRAGMRTGLAALVWAVAALAAAPVLDAAGEASAQDRPRSGFWAETAAGTGAARNGCAGCEDVTVAYGSASHIRVGGALSSRVLIGVEIFALDTSDTTLGPGSTPLRGENATLGPIVLWYVGESGFFLKAGAGVARGTFTVTSVTGETANTTRTGSGLTFGVGFDIPMGRWVALTANFGTYVTAIGDVRVEGVLVDDVIATIYEANVGLTIR